MTEKLPSKLNSINIKQVKTCSNLKSMGLYFKLNYKIDLSQRPGDRIYLPICKML